MVSATAARNARSTVVQTLPAGWAAAAHGPYGLEDCSQTMGERSLPQLATQETIRRFLELVELVDRVA